MALVDEVEEFKKFLKKVTILSIGVILILIFFFSFYGLVRFEFEIKYLTPIIPIISLGLGTSILVYTLAGRRRSLWFCTALSLLIPVAYIVGWPPYPILPKSGLWSLIVMISVTTILFLLPLTFMKKFKIWLFILLIPLTCLFIVVGGYLWDVNLQLEFGVHDAPERDEAIRRLGYTSYCGEFFIEPTPGLYVVSWNKTLTGDESIKCYFKIKIKDERPVYVLFNYNFTYSKRGDFGFYHSHGVFTSMEGLEKPVPWIRPFYWYESPATNTTIAIGKFSAIAHTIYIVVSYKPGILSPGENTMEVRWVFELKILWKV